MHCEGRVCSLVHRFMKVSGPPSGQGIGHPAWQSIAKHVFTKIFSALDKKTCVRDGELMILLWRGVGRWLRGLQLLLLLHGATSASVYVCAAMYNACTQCECTCTSLRLYIRGGENVLHGDTSSGGGSEPISQSAECSPSPREPLANQM